LEEKRRPDFAATVDIHRKPGYDPAELLFDPALLAPRLKAMWRLLQRRLGMRVLLDVIGTDASIVRGSHGIEPRTPGDGACLLTDNPLVLRGRTLVPTEVQELILQHVFGKPQ
jgi:hypothetical protein